MPTFYLVCVVFDQNDVLHMHLRLGKHVCLQTRVKPKPVYLHVLHSILSFFEEFQPQACKLIFSTQCDPHPHCPYY